MKNIFTGILTAAALAGCTIAMAGGPDNMATPAPAPAAAPTSNFMSTLNGLYVGTDLGYSVMPNEFTPASSLTDDGFAYAFHAGYNFDQYVGVEAGYLRLPKVGYSADGNFTGFDNNNVYSLMIKGSYPVLAKLNVFAKAGYAVITSDTTLSSNGYSISSANNAAYNPIVAGGVEYRVLPSLGVNVQYTAIIGINSQYPTVDLATAGLNYYF